MPYPRLAVRILCFLLLSGSVFGQVKDDFKNARVGLLPAAVDAIDGGVDISGIAHHFILGLKWNDTAYQFNAFVTNDHPADLNILGVQTSLGLYVVNIPSKIPANGKAVFTLIWIGNNGAANGPEFLRVLTPVGEKTLQIDPQQEQVITFDTHELAWQVGGRADAKTVTINCGNYAKVTSVQAAGAGNTAMIVAQSAGVYKIVVTPASVATAETFPVIVQISPAITGVPTVIRCSVNQ